MPCVFGDVSKQYRSSEMQVSDGLGMEDRESVSDSDASQSRSADRNYRPGDTSSFESDEQQAMVVTSDDEGDGPGADLERRRQASKAARMRTQKSQGRPTATSAAAPSSHKSSHVKLARTAAGGDVSATRSLGASRLQPHPENARAAAMLSRYQAVRATQQAPSTATAPSDEAGPSTSKPSTPAANAIASAASPAKPHAATKAPTKAPSKPILQNSTAPKEAKSVKLQAQTRGG